MHCLCYTKELLNSDTGSQTCPAYFVLSSTLLSGITADLQSHFHKACIYRAEVAHASCRVTASPRSTANSDSFLSAMAIGTHRKPLFLIASYLIEFDVTSGLPLQGKCETHSGNPKQKVEMQVSLKSQTKAGDGNQKLNIQI